MGRQSILKIGILNFTSAHEDSESYKSAFLHAFKSRAQIELAKHRYAMITSIEVKRDGLLVGTIARFNEIDLELPWFDIEKLNTADHSIISQINIPERARPNYTIIYFAVDYKKHKLYYTSRSPSGSFAAKEANKFFTRLFSNEIISKVTGNYNWSIVSIAGSFDSIIEGIELKTVEIIIQRPNPDDHGELEQRIRDRLASTNTRQYSEKFIAQPGEAIEPDQEMVALAEISETNGETKISGRNAVGASESRSTENYPEIISHKFPPDLVSEKIAFVNAVEEHSSNEKLAQRQF